MCIGDHVNSTRFGLAEIQDNKIDGYLLMSWLKDHNPDIDWAKGILTWRSDYCKGRRLSTLRRLQFITEEELLADNASSVYLLGMAEFTNEEGKDIAFKLLPEYKDYGDIFSQERIESLPQHSKYDHKIELQPDTTPPLGPIYPL